MPNTHTPCLHKYNRYCLDRSRNSASCSSPCARARRSSHPPSWTRWTPSGPNGVPNGSGEEKYSTSASPILLECTTRRLTGFVLFCFFNSIKFLGARFRPAVPTRCGATRRRSWDRVRFTRTSGVGTWASVCASVEASVIGDLSLVFSPLCYAQSRSLLLPPGALWSYFPHSLSRSRIHMIMTCKGLFVIKTRISKYGVMLVM